MHEANFNKLFIIILHFAIYFVMAFLSRVYVSRLCQFVYRFLFDKLTQKLNQQKKKIDSKRTFNHNERFRKIVDFWCNHSKKWTTFNVQKSKNGENMFSALELCVCVCLHSEFGPIQKSMSIYNGLSAEPEMVVSLSMCMRVYIFFLKNFPYIPFCEWKKITTVTARKCCCVAIFHEYSNCQ